MRLRRTQILGLAAGGSLALAGFAAAHGSPGGGKPSTIPPPPRHNYHPHGDGSGSQGDTPPGLQHDGSGSDDNSDG
jgi:hypothetical protein